MNTLEQNGPALAAAVDAAETVLVRPAPPSASHWLVCAIWRELRGPPRSAPTAGSVPANVYACLNLISMGRVVVRNSTPRELPSLSAVGPLSAPLSTLAESPLRSLSLVIQPWVLATWSGRPVESLVDALLGAEMLGLSLEARTLLQAAVDQPDLLEQSLDAVRPALEPAVTQGRPLEAALLATGGVADAARTLGLSRRAFERYFVRAHGHKPKTWMRIKRFETAMIHAVSDASTLAQVSAASGYADQAHMTRDFQRIAGSPPGLARAAALGGVAGYWALAPASDAAVARLVRGEP